MTRIDSDHRQWIDEAMEQIGPSEENDRQLLLPQHPTKYASIELGSILRGSEVEAEVELYSDYDAQAIASQKKFKTTAGKANRYLFLAATMTASIMAIGILFHEHEYLNYFQLTVALAGSGFAAMAGVMLNRVRTGGMLARWSQYRSKAELYRIRYFRLVTQQAIEAAGPAIGLQSLEYFRRFQLEIQETYFGVRGKEHAEASEKTLERSTLLVGLVTLITMTTAIVAGFGEAVGAAFAAVALSVQAYATTLTQREAQNQDRANAERYSHTREKLIQLRGRLDEVRREVAAGKRDILTHFVDAVHEVLTAEHSQWTESVGDIGSALDQLNTQLEAQKQSEPPDLTGPRSNE